MVIRKRTKKQESKTTKKQAKPKKTKEQLKKDKKDEKELTALEAMILDMIKKYAPIKRKDIVQANSMFTDRNVRKTIENLRKKGNPICNVGEGYFMPKSKTDILNCIEYMQRSISGQLTTIENMNKGLMTFGKKR